MIALMFKPTRPANLSGTTSCPPESNYHAPQKTRRRVNAAAFRPEARVFHESTLDVDAEGLPLWMGTDRKIFSGFLKPGDAIIWNESAEGIELTSFGETQDPFCYSQFGDFNLFHTNTERAIEGAKRVCSAASHRISLLASDAAEVPFWRRWIADATSAINRLSEKVRA
jgi:hypothetical protein